MISSFHWMFIFEEMLCQMKVVIISRDLWYSGILRSVEWWYVTGLPVGTIFEGQAIIVQ
jgi:hypothetical protein